MLEIMFILFNIIAFMLFFIGIEYEGEHMYWNPLMTMFSWILFLVLLGYSTKIEMPYQMFNVTSGSIQTGYQTFYTGDFILIYFGFFIATFLYFLDLVLHQQLLKLFKRF